MNVCNYEYLKVFRHHVEKLRARGAAIAVKRETYLHPPLTWISNVHNHVRIFNVDSRFKSKKKTCLLFESFLLTNHCYLKAASAAKFYKIETRLFC